MAYIGKSIESGTFSVLDTSGNTYNGSNTTFNLGSQVGSPAQLLVSHDGVIQKPGTDYSLASGGTQITFSTAPASGASIFIVEISGAVGGPLDSDLNGAELILDADGDTTITADTDDQIDFKIAGADDLRMTANNINVLSGTTLTIDSGATITNSGTANGFAGAADNYFATSGLSSKDLGVGLHIKTADSGASVNAIADEFVIEGSGSVGMTFASGNTSSGNIFFADDGGNEQGAIQYDHNANRMKFRVNNSDRMFIDSSGNLLHAKTSADSNTVGIELRPTGELTITRTNNQLLDINRTDNDGTLVTFRQANQTEGTISVSGGTVSYNSFAGSHWSRLADNSKPTILRGTVMESISTLMDWYQVEYTKDEETLTEYIGALPDGKSVGDSHTVTVDGVEYTGTISKEDNERLPKCKISDTEDSKAVYGVFMDWDNDDDNVNDMYVTALGAFVVRIHGDETVAIGDYLQSKGDGTAKVQADDILRASTIAKVTSTEKTHTYDDGSYCVPCTLHCG